MGRAKLKMELIEKEKSRINTFKKRKEGLIKKLDELTTLCAVPACMIIHDPTTNTSTLWPQDSDEVRRLIDGYKARTKELGGIRSYGLREYFTERQKQIEAELVKLRKKNLEAKFPTWHESLCFMDETQLRNLGAALRGKAAMLRSRIDFIKNTTAMALNYPNVGAHFYGHDAQEIKNPTVLDMLRRNPAAEQSVPNYYYAPPPMQMQMPMPMQMQMPMQMPMPAQPYMLQPNMGYSSMDENVNWWSENGDDITRYLLH